jgi:hypothetical protein
LRELVIHHFLTEPKIRNFDNTVMEEDVGGFEVPMQYFFSVKELKGRTELREDFDGFLFGEFLLGFDEVGKGAAIAELVYEVDVVVGSEHLDELDDVGVTDFGEDADLVVGELAQFGSLFEFVNVHHLHCIKVLCFSVLGAVDIAVLALPYALHQHVVFHHFVHYLAMLLYSLNYLRKSNLMR